MTRKFNVMDRVYYMSAGGKRRIGTVNGWEKVGSGYSFRIAIDTRGRVVHRPQSEITLFEKHG